MRHVRTAILLLAACSAPPPSPPPVPLPPTPGAAAVDLPPFDRAAVERRYPALAGLFITAEDAAKRHPELARALENPKAWNADDAALLEPGTEARILIAGLTASVLIPKPDEPLELPPMVRSVREGLSIGDVERFLQKTPNVRTVKVSCLPKGAAADTEGWIWDYDHRLGLADTVRIVVDGRTQSLKVSAGAAGVEMMPEARVAVGRRRVGEVCRDLRRAFGSPDVKIWARDPSQPIHLPRTFSVVGAVFNMGRQIPGQQRSFIAADMRVAVGKAYGAKPEAAINQVILVRCAGDRIESVLVADLLTGSDRAWPPPDPAPYVRDGDVIVVPRIPDEGQIPVGWEPIGRFAAGRLSRENLIRELIDLYD